MHLEPKRLFHAGISAAEETLVTSTLGVNTLRAKTGHTSLQPRAAENISRTSRIGKVCMFVFL